MKLFLVNISKIFRFPLSIIAGVFSWSIMLYGSYYFTHPTQIIWNLGYNFYLTQIVIDIIIATLFGIFLAATVYKIMYFRQFSFGQNTTGLVWWFFGVIVSGCPLCSITLASYLGIASLLSFFPYGWIELKFISLFLLIYAVYATVINLEVCKLKK